MKILITGIHGFVARNMVAAWAGVPDFDLYGLGRTADAISGVKKIFTWDELLSHSIDTDFATIIHLAGIAHDTSNQKLADEYRQVNLGLSKQIFEYFQQSDAQKFIFFSSVKSAAERTEANDCLSENISPRPQSPYGKSKLMAEKYILSQSLAAKKSVYILRPAMIHGPKCKGNLPLLYKVVSRGFPWPLGAFDNLRSFASIDNVIHITHEIIRRTIPSGIYNVADDQAVSTNRLICVIAVSLGRKARIWHINKHLINICALIGSTLHLPLTRERLHKLSENFVVSNEKIRTELGLDHLPVTSLEGLHKTIISLSKNK